jgi:predicted ATPase
VDIVSLQYFYGLSKRYRSTNVGFGITYTLPILIALLSATPDTLILLENPEAHLHPKGQSKMGELLALAASGGVQIIVETHSDHILNGIRLAVRRGVKPEDIQLHYFDRYLQKGQAITKIISPRIYQDGGIDKWPDGFFDQAEKDLMELL